VDKTDMQSVKISVARQKRMDGIRCPGPGVSQLDHWLSVGGRDLAVLRLARPVEETMVGRIGQFGDPVAIAAEFAKGNTDLVVLGFGHTELGDEDRKTLAIVPILSLDCSGNVQGIPDRKRYGCVQGAEILAKDSKRAVGPCPGDSGGGAYMIVRTQGGSRRSLVIGLVSRAVLNSRRCGDGAIYTLLTPEHIKWIRETAAALASS
jgi:hypothetical protein